MSVLRLCPQGATDRHHLSCDSSHPVPLARGLQRPGLRQGSSVRLVGVDEARRRKRGTVWIPAGE